jgi:DNA-directed RNA polymerase subunit beta'
MLFSSLDEVSLAYENGSVGLHAIINVLTKDGWQENTTVGRAILNLILPEELGYVNEMISKSD